MKTNINTPFLLIALIFAVWACNDYEEFPADAVSLDYVFSATDSTGHQAKDYLTWSIYDVIPNGYTRLGNDYLDAASDDAITSSLTENDVYRLSIGRYTASSLIGNEMYWGNFYRGIRKVANFITHVDVVPLQGTFDDGKPLLKAWKGEARFLRAYFYFELVKRYGGVPLMGDRLYTAGDDIQLPRNSFEECINYIVSELDAVKDDMRTLPLSASDTYVATREAALALKCRVLLYAASPLFNGGTQEDGNSLVGYTDYSAERWKRAAEEAEAFINQYGPSGTEPEFELAADFRDAFLNHYTPANREIIFFRNAGRGTSVENRHGPVGFSGNSLGNGQTSPTQQLVDAFPMKDGRPLGDPASKYPYNAMKPYDNRDPRLDYTILHNESQWLNGTLETFAGGKNNPAGNSQTTKTGYYARKFMGKFETANAYSNVLHVWGIFRYAEILLNFAEAQNEYDSAPSARVYQAVKDLRKRAGIEPGDNEMYGLDENMTKEQMRDVIRNERRIEMAFEEHRFYDIRRWKIAGDLFGKPLTGVVPVKQYAGFEYNEFEVLNAPFETRRYLHPIPYSEVIKNGKMIQNPGWE